jgi:site-specific recombinase XerD
LAPQHSRGRLCHTQGPSFGDWHFPSPKGSRYDVDNFSQALRAANQKAGLSCTCLIYRHTFGQQLAMKGESLYKIAALMGNSPELFRRHYAALIPEALGFTVEFSLHQPQNP